MDFEVLLTPAAERDPRRVSTHEALRRIADEISGLATEPGPRSAKKLTGRPAWRVRVGDYRVIYEVDGARRAVTVVRVRHRRDAYR